MFAKFIQHQKVIVRIFFLLAFFALPVAALATNYFTVAQPITALGPTDNSIFSNVSVGTNASSTFLRFQKGGVDIFKVDTSGNIVMSGNLTMSGSMLSFLNANYISAGAFGLLTGGGNYMFPASVRIGTTTAPTKRLEVDGGIISQSGYNVSDAATDNMVVNGDFEMGGTYGWSGNGMAIVSGGYSGNYALQVTGPGGSLLSDDYIPVDDTKDTFQLEVWAKKTVAGATPGVLYLGYIAYDANKASIGTAPCGSYCYFAASGYVLPADGVWHKFSATTVGEGTVYPNFPVGTKYVRVLGLVNYNASVDAVTLIDHVSLKSLSKGPLVVGNNFSASNMLDQNQFSSLYTNASNNLIISSPGNVGIGTTTVPDALYVSGSVGLTGALNLPMSSTTVGMIKLSGQRYLHSFGNVNNTFIGYQAGNTTLTATEDTFIGNTAGTALTSGSYNTAIGNWAGKALTSGGMNTLIGRYAGYLISTGNYNTLVGVGAGESWTGSSATAIGYYAGRYTSTGNNNLSLGNYSNYSGNGNSNTVAVGPNSLYSSTNGSNNIALGYNADYFVPPATFSATPVSGSNMGIGGYYYRVSYVLSVGETNPSPLVSVSTVSGSQAVNLSSLPIYSGPFTCTARKIYRNKVGAGGAGPFYYVGPVSDNVTTTYSDTTADASLTVSVNDSANSIIIGANAVAFKAGQLILGAAQNEIYLGKGVYTPTPGIISLFTTGGQGTDNPGGSLVIAGGPGTGAGLGGSITFKTAPAGTSGTSWNSLIDRMVIASAGQIGIGSSSPNTAQLVIATSTNGYSIDGGNFKVGGVAMPAAATDAANKSYVDSAVSAAQAAFWNLSGSNLYTSSTSWNVGIGTSTPADKLHVYGNTFLGKISGYPFKSLWSWDSDNSGYYSGVGYQKNDATNQKLFMWWKDNVVETNINSVLNIGTPGHTFDGGAPNTGRTIGISLNTSGVSYFNGGNVGVGTTNANSKFTVTGGSSAAAGQWIQSITSGTGVATDEMLQFGVHDGDYSWIQAIKPGSGYRNISLNPNGGNVGIGTTGPTAKLHIKANGTNFGQGGVRFEQSADSSYWDIMPAGNTLYFGYNGATYLQMNASGLEVGQPSAGQFNHIAYSGNSYFVTGNVGIGTTSPSTARLVVATSTNAYSIDGGNFKLGGVAMPVAATDATNKSYVDSAVSAAQAAFWSLSGLNLSTASTTWNVGIGITNPGGKLEIQRGNDSGVLARMGTNDGVGGKYYFDFSRSASTGALSIQGNQAGANNIVLAPTSGAVGIGTPYPGYALDVTGRVRATDGFMVLDTSVPGNMAIFTDNIETDKPGLYDSNDFGIVVRDYTNDFVALRGYMLTINSDGNVGIGTGQTNNSAKLTVLGKTYIGVGEVTDAFVIRNEPAANNQIRVDSSDNNVIFSENSGNVGIASSSPTTAKLVIGGNVGGYSIDGGNSKVGGIAMPIAATDAVNKSYVDSAIAPFISSSTLTNYALASSSNAFRAGSISVSGNISLTGGGNITGINKLTVNTIDPLYRINGINFSSFAGSIVGGVKEEYLGRLKISDLRGGWLSFLDNNKEYEYRLDFSKLKETNDLWVWRQTIDFSPENVEVSITPYGSFANTYYSIEDNTIIFRSDRPVEISYRLSGKRYDWRNWPTRAIDQQETAGFIINTMK